VWHSGLVHGVVGGEVFGGMQCNNFEAMHHGEDENKLKPCHQRWQGEKLLNF